jgi:membrane fusion protein, heavy metal efflux system
MYIRTLAVMLLTATTLAVAAGLWLTQETWRPWLIAEQPTATEHDHAHGEEKDRVKLTPQARANLRLVVKPVALRDEYWRTLLVPGQIVEQPGRSDRTVAAPVTGVVEAILAVPGDTVRPDGKLFTLRLNSESLQSTQTELFKTAQEVKISQKQSRLIEGSVRSGALPEQRLIDLQFQLDRFAAARKAYRADLTARGFSPEQLDQVEEGTFVRQTTVRAPNESGTDALFEVEELKVQPGEQVQQGQTLCRLADHRHLFVEGRAFKEDAALVERSIANNWPVRVEVVQETGGDWKPIEQAFAIHHVTNTTDADSTAFSFYVPLVNPHREHKRDGRTLRLWTYRAGQKARLGVRVEKFEKVFVLPAAAVVREGPETYVFRQNGQVFDRVAVHVRFEDAGNVVVENDGSLVEGDYVAHNAAAALNRALKAAQESGHGGHDHHHDH